MKPEQLKVIAEGMGYEVATTFDFLPRENTVFTGDCSRTFSGRAGYCKEYNPLTNNDQMVEIMEKAHISAEPVLWNEEWGWKSYVYDDEEECYGETVNEAVCNKAYEYFKDKK